MSNANFFLPIGSDAPSHEVIFFNEENLPRIITLVEGHGCNVVSKEEVKDLLPPDFKPDEAYLVYQLPPKKWG